METIIQFFKGKVLGRALHTDELIYKLEDGKLEGVYSDQIMFSNLKYSESGMCFDMFVISKEKIYELDGKKQHAALVKDFSGVALFRYELANRKSTGKITGTLRFISGTGKNIPAEAIVSGVYDIELHDEELAWKEQQILYRDQPSNNETHRSVAFDSINRFFFEKDKLRYEYNGTCYDINGDTLEKHLSKDTFPCFVSKEK